MCSAAALLRAYFYAMVLGREGMIRVGEHSTLSLRRKLKVFSLRRLPAKLAAPSFFDSCSRARPDLGCNIQ
jgi:hypothetical protein